MSKTKDIFNSLVSDIFVAMTVATVILLGSPLLIPEKLSVVNNEVVTTHINVLFMIAGPLASFCNILWISAHAKSECSEKVALFGSMALSLLGFYVAACFFSVPIVFEVFDNIEVTTNIGYIASALSMLLLFRLVRRIFDFEYQEPENEIDISNMPTEILLPEGILDEPMGNQSDANIGDMILP